MDGGVAVAVVYPGGGAVDLPGQPAYFLRGCGAGSGAGGVAGDDVTGGAVVAGQPAGRGRGKRSGVYRCPLGVGGSDGASIIAD